MTDFLFELRSEEIPAGMQAGARTELEKLFRREMAAAGITPGEVTVWSTPRRLALIARGLPDATEAVSEEAKGPPKGAPEAALEGFCRKNGVTKDQLQLRDVKGRQMWFAVIDKPGRATKAVLAEAIPAIVRDFAWPKSMRWGAASISTESPRWVRPLSGIVAILGEELVECEAAGVASGFATLGHRFNHSGPITIGSAADYAEKLRACHVIVDQEERAALIREGAAQAAAEAGLTLVEDEGLVIENAGLTEWPVPLLGAFDPAFLEVPREVIQLTMRTNQKYFAVTDADGRLAPNFLCTANIEASDGGAAIIAGNERVLSARLADAKFFWEQDLKVPLAEQAEKLSQIVFHEKLGTVADKVDRVAKLARWLVEEGIVVQAGSLSPAGRGQGEGERASSERPTSETKSQIQSPLTQPSPPQGEGFREQLATLAETAARLCKADLVTGLVGEFPELQGIIGGHLARAQGLDPQIADAIRDHYKPVGQGDDVPTAPVTVAVSLADKLDTLAGFFGRTLKPTGSKDPFALRRAMISALAILIENDIRIGFHRLLLAATKPYLAIYGGARDELLEFAVDRLKVQQREAGVRHDLIDAVFALGGEDDLVRLLARVRALQAFVETAEGSDLLAGYKRAANILKKEGWAGASANRHPELDPGSMNTADGGLAQSGSMDPDFRQDDADGEQSRNKPLSYSPEKEEAALIAALDSAGPRAAAAVGAEDFEGAMAALAGLRAPVDAFFNMVTVNDPDPARREARLDLLARMRDAVHRVADFSRIEG